jgi:PPP family 3-phenylpropionic acid transporter
MIKDKNIIKLQYFLYFGAMGVFLPYFNLYCLEIGFSGFQIGSLSAVRSTVLILFAILWSVLADRKGLRRPIYILCSVVSTALWSLYLLTTDFRLMLLLTIVYGAFYAPIISFLEAFAMDVLGNAKHRYGNTRVWGSVAFIGVVMATGKLIDPSGITIVIPIFLVISCLHATVAILIPHTSVSQPFPTKKSVRLFSPQTMVFLFCAFLMLVSHGAYYGFFSIHLNELGIGGGLIGLCWALASASEMIVMLTSNKIFARYSFRRVLAFSFAIATLRWVILYSVQTPMAILASQTLHALTYGAFHMAGILYMDQLSPPSNKTLGQAINNAVTYGLGLTVGFFASGALFKSGHSADLFLFSAVVSSAAGLIFIGYHQGWLVFQKVFGWRKQ